MFATDDRDELQDVLNAFQIAMYAVEKDRLGRLICAGHNDLVCELTGYDSADTLDKPLESFMRPKDLARVSAVYAECFETGKPVHASYDIAFPTGPIVLTSTVVPVFGSDNSICRLIGNSVGLKGMDENHYFRLLDDLTRLSVEGSSTLYDALRAIEVRRESGEITPAEEQFLGVFSRLSERALHHSLAIRETLLRAGKTTDPQQHLLDDSALAKAITELTDT